jgi:tetratricopeptide (TPR) repeat protein
MHFAAASCRPEALRYSIAAADEAAAALAFDSAARFCRMALELEPAEHDAILSLQRKLGEALSNAGRGAEAAEAYLRAADLAGLPDALEDRRRAAWQYLVSGHVDQGRTVIQTLLTAIGTSLARSPRRALLSLLLGRARINIRGLHYRDRPTTEVAKKDLIRVDTCFSVAQGLGFIDTIHAADFHARHILLALRTGEKYRVARALTIEAGYHGLAGTRGKERTQQILDAAIALSRTCDDPHALGLSMLVEGTCAFLQGRWNDGRETFTGAETLLLERCVGSVWELATARLQRSACSFFIGDWNELRQRLPALLADADARGDLYLATALRTRLGHMTPLATDQPEEALEVIRSAIAKWSVEGFHTQHWWSLTSQCDILLYQQCGLEAWNLMNQQWPALSGSMLLRIQYFLIESLYHRACSALAVAGESAGNGTRGLHFARAAARDAARIECENAPWGNGLAYLVRAAALAMQRRHEAAEPLLRSAENALESADMHLFAAATRHRRGEIIKGDEGIALIKSAEGCMRQQGIQSPERLAGMLAPGHWS